MKIPNLQLPYDLLPDPMLAEMLEKLSIERPNWFYHLPKVGRDIASSSVKNGTRSPEGMKFTRNVVVLENGSEAGRIAVEREYRYRGDDRFVYVIASRRIDNGRRGDRKSSSKLDVAVRNAKKHFDPIRRGEILYDAMGDVQNALSRNIGALNAPIANGWAIRSAHVEVQNFVYAILKGIEPDPSDFTTVKECVLTPAFEDSMAKFQLGKAMAKRDYRVVMLTEDGYMMWAEDHAPSCTEEAKDAKVLILPFDMLPPGIQDKLAVLQLMQDRELVLDVGFRYNENLFLIAID